MKFDEDTHTLPLGHSGGPDVKLLYEISLHMK